jgi:hypothetical protein
MGSIDVGYACITCMGSIDVGYACITCMHACMYCYTTHAWIGFENGLSTCSIRATDMVY